MYTPPVNSLLTIGRPIGTTTNWPDYPHRYHLTAANLPELIQMMNDTELFEGEREDTKIYGPIHAWRAIAQLQDSTALPALFDYLRHVDIGDDWFLEDTPYLFLLFGPVSLPYCASFLAETDLDHEWGQVSITEAIKRLGQQYPETRDECVAIMVEALGRYREQVDTLNTYLILNLVELKAVEAAGLMEEVFAAELADDTVMGDWQDVQIRLGLLDKRISPPRRTKYRVQIEEARDSLDAFIQTQRGTSSSSESDEELEPTDPEEPNQRQRLHEIAKKKKAKSAKKKKRRK